MSNVPMTLPQFMLAEHDTPFGHQSTFLELNDGRYFHLAGRMSNYSEDCGLTWSKPQYER